ncbi:MAG: hypothetical protein AAF357_15590, partial [Verrucomicrobiota bacterium]
NQPATESDKETLLADSWKRSPVYFYGYNESNYAHRVHEVAAVVSMASNHPDWEVSKITVAGRGEMAAVALGAQVLMGNQIDHLAIETGEFRFGDVTDFKDDNMVPGAVKYGDIEGLRNLAIK